MDLESSAESGTSEERLSCAVKDCGESGCDDDDAGLV